MCFERAGISFEFGVAWIGCEHAVDVPVESRPQRLRVVIVCGVNAGVVVVNSLERRTVDRRGRLVALALTVLFGQFEEVRDVDCVRDHWIVPRVPVEQPLYLVTVLFDRLAAVAKPCEELLTQVWVFGECIAHERT